MSDSSLGLYSLIPASTVFRRSLHHLCWPLVGMRFDSVSKLDEEAR